MIVQVVNSRLDLWYFGLSVVRTVLPQLEKDRGMVNPQGIAQGYARVRVRVWISIPSTNPYPSWGY